MIKLYAHPYIFELLTEHFIKHRRQWEWSFQSLRKTKVKVVQTLSLNFQPQAWICPWISLRNWSASHSTTTHRREQSSTEFTLFSSRQERFDNWWKITHNQPQHRSFTVRRAGLCCIHKRFGMSWLQLKLCKSWKMDLQRFFAFTGIQVCVIPSSAHWALLSACWNWLSGS